MNSLARSSFSANRLTKLRTVSSLKTQHHEGFCEVVLVSSRLSVGLVTVMSYTGLVTTVCIALLAFNCIRGVGAAYFHHVCISTANLSGQAGLRFCGTWRSGRAENSNGTRQTKFQRCRCGHLEQSSRTFTFVIHLRCTAPAWIENTALPAGLQPLGTLC